MNRIIVPEPYRAACTSADKQYLCPACVNPQRSSLTTIIQDTTCLELKEENDVHWLGFKPEMDLFVGKSAFKIIQAHDFSVFDVGSNEKALKMLTLQGKKVLDPEKVLAQVEGRVEGGHVDLGTCNLCFEEMARGKLFQACGRSGCKQKVDDGCLREWELAQYGKSEPGELLNLMQLTCPFCRRKPTVKTLARYNTRAATLGGLEAALTDNGWFYAWCISCGFAKRAHERVCCEGDRVPVVQDFRCEDCRGVATNVDGVGRLTSCPKCGVMVEKVCFLAS
ncbi:hypothetical protein HWV62_11764 [Athelia sp. TMB]|nr:hypothetical protein HWV62_11764 [Athelia sp. TMB]